MKTKEEYEEELTTREKRRKYQRAYYKKNRMKILAYMKDYYNKGEDDVAVRSYKYKNKGGIRIYAGDFKVVFE
tara:strand:- start:184 stop:402 length:219 start_codon:yes stop_codon:yes gene_type:complete